MKIFSATWDIGFIGASNIIAVKMINAEYGVSSRKLSHGNFIFKEVTVHRPNIKFKALFRPFYRR